MDALKTAAKQVLGEQKKAMRDVVSGLDGAALNWKPIDGQDTNSIAVLLSHALDAERYLVASSVDVTLDRDREAQFRVEVASDADL
ncbi:MAG: DinB family protein, partial [Chloroflexota bacterium]|nr:DinB family protein [Chloroflexota bacterium]